MEGGLGGNGLKKLVKLRWADHLRIAEVLEFCGFVSMSECWKFRDCAYRL